MVFFKDKLMEEASLGKFLGVSCECESVWEGRLGRTEVGWEEGRNLKGIFQKSNHW